MMALVDSITSLMIDILKSQISDFGLWFLHLAFGLLFFQRSHFRTGSLPSAIAPDKLICEMKGEILVLALLVLDFQPDGSIKRSTISLQTKFQIFKVPPLNSLVACSRSQVLRFALWFSVGGLANVIVSEDAVQLLFIGIDICYGPLVFQVRKVAQHFAFIGRRRRGVFG